MENNLELIKKTYNKDMNCIELLLLNNMDSNNIEDVLTELFFILTEGEAFYKNRVHFSVYMIHPDTCREVSLHNNVTLLIDTTLLDYLNQVKEYIENNYFYNESGHYYKLNHSSYIIIRVFNPF